MEISMAATHNVARLLSAKRYGVFLKEMKGLLF